jgi:hypothetical protein
MKRYIYAMLFIAVAVGAVWFTPAHADAQSASLLRGIDRSLYDDPNGNTHVVCEDDAAQSYELYIPSSAPDTASPILYVFDPGADGKGSLLRLAAAAAESGWILAASNNSKNGPWEAIFTAQDALLHDTESRLNLHPTRRFAAGMSGGARASLALAFRYPDKVCGTLLLAAGWPVNTDLQPSTKRLVGFMIMGTDDGNYTYDFPQTLGKLVAYGIRCGTQTFSGGHVWPSAALISSGCRWLNEKAETDPNSGLAPSTCTGRSMFGQPPTSPDDSSWKTHVSDTDSQLAVFDNFQGLQAPISRIEWWGIDATYNYTAGYWLPCEPDSDVFTVSIHPDDGGLPGTAVHGETVTATRTDLPALYSRNYQLRHYSARLSSPVRCASGWVRIQHEPTSDRLFLLLNTGGGDGHSLTLYEGDDTYEQTPGDIAVCLSSEQPTIVGRTGWMEEGTPLDLTVMFPGAIGETSYAWYKDGAPLTGETDAILQVESLTLDDSGWYSCRVSDEGKGLYETDPVLISVFPQGSLPIASGVWPYVIAASLAMAGVMYQMKAGKTPEYLK